MVAAGDFERSGAGAGLPTGLRLLAVFLLLDVATPDRVNAFFYWAHDLTSALLFLYRDVLERDLPLSHFLAACSADKSCAFYNNGDAEGAPPVAFHRPRQLRDDARRSGVLAIAHQ